MARDAGGVIGGVDGASAGTRCSQSQRKISASLVGATDPGQMARRLHVSAFLVELGSDGYKAMGLGSIVRPCVRCSVFRVRRCVLCPDAQPSAPRESPPGLVGLATVRRRSELFSSSDRRGAFSLREQMPSDATTAGAVTSTPWFQRLSLGMSFFRQQSSQRRILWVRPWSLCRGAW